MRRTEFPACVLAVCAIAAPTSPQCVLAELAAGDAGPNDQLGRSVDYDHGGGRFVAGSIYDDVASTVDAGSAYVFERVGGSWVQVAKLVPSNIQAGANAGDSVGIEGDVIVIGAPRIDDSTMVDRGAAFVFERQGSTWVQTAELAAGGGNFGAAVAIGGGTIAVGALEAVFVFRKVGGTWSHVASLKTSGVPGEGIGTREEGCIAIDADGDRIVAGADLADGPGPLVNSGRVYVFDEPPSGWTGGGTFGESASFVPSSVTTDYQFGITVSVAGDFVAAGRTTEGGSQILAAHVFELQSGVGWVEVAELVPSDPQSANGFGRKVAITPDRVLVGATGGTNPGPYMAGKVYSFDRSGSSWGTPATTGPLEFTETLQLAPGNLTGSSLFGVDIGADGPGVAVGCPKSDCGATDGGSVYVADVSDAPCEQPAVVSYGCEHNPCGSLYLVSGTPALGVLLVLGIADPTGSVHTPAPTLLYLSGAPDPNLPSGTPIPGFQLGGVGPGALLISPVGALPFGGPLWFGDPPMTQPHYPFPVPLDCTLIGKTIYAQGALIDLSISDVGLTNALEIHLGV